MAANDTRGTWAVAVVILFFLVGGPAHAQITSGTYQGNGTAGRQITGLGFQPDVVIVKVDYSHATDDLSSGVVRTSTMSGVNSKPVKGNQNPLPNLITSIDTDGFTVGNDLMVNNAATCSGACTYYWVAAKANAHVKVGTYTGSSTGAGDTLSVTGLGFSPEFVTIYPDSTHRAVLRFNADMNSYHWWSGGADNPGVISLDANGFTVEDTGGGSYNANNDGETYHYFAVNDVAGLIRVGSYVAPGGPSFNVTTVGFEPHLVLVKVLEPDSSDPIHKTPGMVGNLSINFRQSSITGGITGCLPNGFSVGSSGTVNSAGQTYAYLAMGTGACCALGTTTGSGTVTVTAPSKFEMTFDAGVAGGAIAEFYDLVEDPGRGIDLAGSLETSSSPRGLHNFGMMVAGTNYNAANNAFGARLDLLEATAARVRVRPESFYQNSIGGPILAGVKGVGDYSVYGTGRVAVHWERQTTSAVTYDNEYSELVVHYVTPPPPPLDSWAAYRELGVGVPVPPNGTGNDAFVMAESEVVGARTDFLQILYQTWTAANGYPSDADLTGRSISAGSERLNIYWWDGDSMLLPAGTRHTWDSLTYFKPVDCADDLDTAVTSRSNDYRSPSTIVIGGGRGSRWVDDAENTPVASPTDFFNEAEAAYVVNISPTMGLQADIDGTAANPRYSPFFKIRQWRSSVAYPTARLEGVTLAPDADYIAAVKPVSRAPFADDLTWHSTLQDAAAVTSPDVGTGGTVNNGNDFPAARYGSGARFDTDGEYLSIPPAGNFNPAEGAIEFWYQPGYDYGGDCGDINDDFGLFGYWIDVDNFFFAWHEPYQGGAGTGEGVSFRVEVGGVQYDTSLGAGPSFPEYWRANDWVHLRFVWKADPASRLEISVNGVLRSPAPVGSYAAPVALDTAFWIGDRENGNVFTNNAEGIIDEFRIYDTADAPTPLAHGGLIGHGEERLADAASNSSFSFGAVDANRRGEYAYFGTDAKVRGLNVVLQTLGAGSSPDLQWEYWSGASGNWEDLESGFGFVDQTASFTLTGSVYWTSDPTGWAAYSVNGSPDLYYVRAYLASGDYATQAPVESRITTDILLFQLCGDITAAAQTLEIGPPVPTAVELVSFEATPLDAAVDLEWRTGSELDNLGFHLYRSLSEHGPWTRITPSLIPGLGSSPAGASYSFRDTGLQNGTPYFYRLEDIDTSSVSTFHGPVSATPSASASPEDSDDDDAEDDPDSDDGSDDSGSGTQAYGAPGEPSLRVLSRTARSVVLELTTPGCVATWTPAGVRVSVPGFDARRQRRAPALPLKRALLDAIVGRHARIVWAKEKDVLSFPGLTPAAVGAAEVFVRPDGTVRPRRRGQSLKRSRNGLLPRSAARIAGDAFIGEAKKLALEMSPIRYDTTSQTLLLTQTLRVKIAFDRRARTEETGRGSRGRRRPRSVRKGPGETGVLAHLHTLSAGLHAVSFKALSLSDPIPLDSLRLSLLGEPVPFHVEPSGDFGPGDVPPILSST